MSDCALPLNLRGKRHTDYVWPLSYLPRSINAKGPRCGKGSKRYQSWPPRLVEGYGVSRWESTQAQSIIEIPAFANIKITSLVYGRTWTAIERNSGHPDYGKQFEIRLDWKEQTVVSTTLDGKEVLTVTPGGGPSDFLYSPSAIQLFSNLGFVKLDPGFYAEWKRLSNKYTLFRRWGWRPDHLDVYYNWGPYLGLSFE